MIDEDLGELRAALEARPDLCWERLADAVTELCALHEVPGELILGRIRAVIAAEQGSIEPPAD